MKDNTSYLEQLGLHIVLLIALIGNVALVWNLGQDITPAAASEELSFDFLITPDCENCFDMQPFKDYFIQSGVSEEDFNDIDYESFKGRRIVKKYSITNVPTLVIHGDVNSHSFMNDMIEYIGETREGSFVVTKVQAPYLDLEEDKLRGEFEAIYLDDESCEECYDIELHKNILERMALKPTKESNLDISSEEGKLLIEEYGVDIVPTILFRGDLEPYDLTQIWDQVGTVEEDGTYILRQGVSSMGAYKQLSTGDIISPQPVEDVEVME